MNTLPAIAMLELDSIAVGTRVADAMIKRAPVREIRVGTVQPGKFLVLVGEYSGQPRLGTLIFHRNGERPYN